MARRNAPSTHCAIAALGSATLLLLLAACAMPGPFAPGAADALPLPARYDATPYPVPQISDSLLGLFDQPGLRSVVRRAMANNPDLMASFARLEEAGFNTRVAASPLYPSLTANASAGRADSPAVPVTTNYRASLDARWELDVWGRIRAGVAAAAATQAAAEADYRSARQSIAAQTMQAWFNLVAAEKLVDLSQRRLASFESTRQLLSRRYESGTGNLGDAELARSDVASARAALEMRLDERARAARLLRTLIGDYPDASLSAGTSWPSLNRSVAAGLPSDLLRSRPDIDAAYQRIRAADARIKVAHADLFPSFALTGSGGRSSSRLNDLARSSFDTWSLLADLSAPILDGGRRRAELGAAGKRAEQAYQAWRAIVLNGFREVEDALGSENHLRLQEISRRTALDAAHSAEAKTRRDYEAGIAEALNLLVAQRLVFSTEEQLINLQGVRLQNRVRLALALGKGA